MVKTRSLYLALAWYTTGSWLADRRTDRIPIANTRLPVLAVARKNELSATDWRLTFFFVVFDVVRVDFDINHLTGVQLQQQFLLLLLHTIDVLDLTRLASLLSHWLSPARDPMTSRWRHRVTWLASLLLLAFDQLLSHLRLQSLRHRVRKNCFKSQQDSFSRSPYMTLIWRNSLQNNCWNLQNAHMFTKEVIRYSIHRGP